MLEGNEKYLILSLSLSIYLSLSLSISLSLSLSLSLNDYLENCFSLASRFRCLIQSLVKALPISRVDPLMVDHWW